MDKAFLELLERKDFAYITVKEVCEKAGVNRSTFYLHYETISDLLSESVQYLYSRFLAYFKSNSDSVITRLRNCPLEELYLVTPEYLTPYLSYIRDHKRLFRTAVDNSSVLKMQDTYDKMYRHVFTPILDRFRVPGEDRDYIMAFYIHGMMAVVTQWLKRDCADPMEHVIAVMQRCVMGRRHETKGEIMKAGIYLGKGKIEIREMAVPEVGYNDVLVKNVYSSICGTDVAVFIHGPDTGHRITVGGEFGHETISRIVKVGKNVTGFCVGERVYPYPRYAKDDTRRAGTIGGFSEYILIPNAKRNHSLYSVDERISDRLASLIEPFTVGCRAARRGMIPCGENQYISGQSAVVFGCGTIGIAAVAFRHFGMDKVMICDRSGFRLKLAEKLGFTTCNSEKEELEAKAEAYFGAAPSWGGKTADIDCWLDAAGAESILNDFLRLGRSGSRFVSVAVNNAPRTIDLLHMTYP